MSETKIQCLGFIMDGNRRWAKAQGLSSLEGHRQGAKAFEESVVWVRDSGIPHAVYYAFSSENWQRSDDEVSYLLELFADNLDRLIAEDANRESVEKVRFRFVGNTEKFSPELQEKIKRIEEKTAQYDDTTIWVALSYGGRSEIVSAVNQAVALGQEVTEESFGGLLQTAGMPDPDLIVRTGGQQRLSNFLPWQSTYSELVFLDEYWPDLSKEILSGLVEDYNSRRRNFGK